MDRQAFYEALEKFEGGKDLVEFARGEFRQIGDVENKYKTTKKDYDTLNEKFEGYKPILDIFSKENLNEETLSELLKKRDDNLSTEEKWQKQLDIVNSNVKTLEEKLSNSEKAKQELEKGQQKGDLKKAFSSVMKNIIPSALDEHLEVKYSNGELLHDSDKKPKIKHGDSYYDPSAYWEVLKKERPEYVVSKAGPGSNSGNDNPGDGSGGKSIHEMSSRELLEMRYKKE